MNKIAPQTFELDRWISRLARLAVWFFAALSVASFGLAIFETTSDPSDRGALVVCLVMAFLFLGFAYAGYRMKLHCERAPVSADDDGIWPVNLGKSTGLVTWNEVYAIKGRPNGQRLDLLGTDRNILIKLDYQLTGFEILRQIVLAKTERRYSEYEVPATFRKSIGYHIFTVLTIIVFTLAAYFVSPEHPILAVLVLAVPVFMGALGYVKTVAGLTIDRRYIHVRYPFSGKTIGLSEVNSIQLIDDFVKGARHPLVIVDGQLFQKPIRLQHLGIDVYTLYDLLDRWKNERL